MADYLVEQDFNKASRRYKAGQIINDLNHPVARLLEAGLVARAVDPADATAVATIVATYNSARRGSEGSSVPRLPDYLNPEPVLQIGDGGVKAVVEVSAQEAPVAANTWAASALAKAWAAIPATGGDLVLPKGGTILLDTLNGYDFVSKNNVTVRGNGCTIKRYAGLINSRVGYIENCNNFKMYDVVFDLNGIANYGGLTIQGGDRIDISYNKWVDTNFGATAFDHNACTIQNATNVNFAWNVLSRSKIEFNANTNYKILYNYFDRPEGSQGISSIALDNATQVFANGEVAFNYVVDARGDALGFGIEPEATGSKTYDGLHIHHNWIIYTGAVTAVESAIYIGSQIAGTGFRFKNIHVNNNTVVYAAGVAPTRSALWMVVQSVEQSFTHSSMNDNTVVGFTTADKYALSTQFWVNCEIKRNLVTPNGAGAKVTLGHFFSDLQNTKIADNHFDVVGLSTAYNYSGSLGGNRFERNTHTGGTTVFGPYQMTAGAGDYIEALRERYKFANVAAVTVLPAVANQVDFTISGISLGQMDRVTAHPIGGSLGNGIMLGQAFPYNTNTVRAPLNNFTVGSLDTNVRDWIVVVERYFGG